MNRWDEAALQRLPIDADGVLNLSMREIRDGVAFEEAELVDIKFSSVPAQHARRVVLRHGAKERVLKDRGDG